MKSSPYCSLWAFWPDIIDLLRLPPFSPLLWPRCDPGREHEQMWPGKMAGTKITAETANATVRDANWRVCRRGTSNPGEPLRPPAIPTQSPLDIDKSRQRLTQRFRLVRAFICSAPSPIAWRSCRWIGAFGLGQYPSAVLAHPHASERAASIAARMKWLDLRSAVPATKWTPNTLDNIP
jgi:hypothetical protein